MKEDHWIRKFFKIILVNSQYFEQLKHSITKSWRINGQYIYNCYFSTVYVPTVIIVYKEKDVTIYNTYILIQTGTKKLFYEGIIILYHLIQPYFQSDELGRYIYKPHVHV